MSFAATFRELVIPRLSVQCVLAASRVSFGEQSFAEAVVEIMADAGRLGAYHLPPSLFDELYDWILTHLAHAIEAEDTARIHLAHAIEDDPVSHYRHMVADAPHLMWIFAAISPAYRQVITDQNDLLGAFV